MMIWEREKPLVLAVNALVVGDHGYTYSLSPSIRCLVSRRQRI